MASKVPNGEQGTKLSYLTDASVKLDLVLTKLALVLTKPDLVLAYIVLVLAKLDAHWIR